MNITSCVDKEYNRILITGALPYANGPLHLGHIAGAYLPADIYARFNRMLKKDVLFICGSDEHGVPITISAEKENCSPQVIIDRYHNMNAESFKKIGISFDHYSRTSAQIHHQTAQEIFLKILENGHLTKKSTKQFYCEKCKMFLADRYVIGICPKCNADGARGDQCEKCGCWLEPFDLITPVCKNCCNTPVIKETAHWFLQMNKFQKQIEEWIYSKKNWKENVINYCNGWFKEGLTERAITRDINWGIKVPLPEANDKVLYVWFEAPIGYISATKEWAQLQGAPDRWKDYWLNEDTKITHFIGKDNIVFHAIVWPIILLASGAAQLPAEIPANEYLNISGQKFSTSRNLAVWVDDVISKYNPDALRYAIAYNMPETRDSDFSWEYFQEKNNNELADNIGNFVNRASVFIKNFYDNIIPEYTTFDTASQKIIDSAKLTRDTMADLISKFQFKEATKTFMAFAKECNKFFNDQAPWHCYKNDKDKCSNCLYVSINLVKWLAQLMSPIMPFTAEKIWKFLNLEGACADSNWQSIAVDFIKPRHKIAIPEILFGKIDDKAIALENQKLFGVIDTKPNQAADNKSQLENKDKLSKQDNVKTTENVANIIDISDFSKIQLRVAEVISCENIKNSKKLLKLQIKIAEETRQIVAGIAEFYKPEEMLGKKIIIVYNLKPAKIFNTDSCGMLLAAKINNQLTLITPEKDIPSGAQVS